MTNRNRLGEIIADWLESIWLYIKFAFFVLGGWVSICEIRDVFLPNLSLKALQAKLFGADRTIPNYWGMIIIVVIAVIIRFIYEHNVLKKCDIKIGGPNITLSIRRGNLLKDDNGNTRKDGTLLIGINDKLKIDDYDVSRGTINSQLLKMFPTDNWLSDRFDEVIVGKDKVEMGSYIDVRHVASSDTKPDLIFTVMSEYNREAAATTSIDNIEKALNTLFMRSNIGCQNNVMYCPILGNNCGLGRSFSREQLILLIAKCFIVNSADTAAVRHLIIIARPETYKRLNKRKLKRMIENMVELSNAGVLREGI